MNAEHYCPKCGWHWITHNDDGSCVQDNEEPFYLWDQTDSEPFDDVEFATEDAAIAYAETLDTSHEYIIFNNFNQPVATINPLVDQPQLYTPSYDIPL